jgi:hypothetical protein
VTNHVASCSCGQLRLTCVGDPVRISICHCLECQKRTGSVFATQARFPRGQVAVEGPSTTWARRGDSGGAVTFHFCPTCGATLFWEPDTMPGFVSVATGAFADPSFPPPHVSVYEERRHSWVMALGQLPLEHQH